MKAAENHMQEYPYTSCLSPLPQTWRDIGIRFSVRSSVRTSVRPSVNICDHPSVDPTVQIHNSETL